MGVLHVQQIFLSVRPIIQPHLLLSFPCLFLTTCLFCIHTSSPSPFSFPCLPSVLLYYNPIRLAKSHCRNKHTHRPTLCPFSLYIRDIMAHFMCRCLKNPRSIASTSLPSVFSLFQICLLFSDTNAGTSLEGSYRLCLRRSWSVQRLFRDCV